MTYTVSHRQGGVQRSAVGGLIRHEFRDIDKSNSVETEHSNERIVAERTHLNVSWMWVDGEEVELTDTRQIVDELDSRLSEAGGTRTNKKTGEKTRIAVREDAKVVRDLVLQLDPTFTRSSEWLTEEGEARRQGETRRLLGEMIDHYGDVYGRENLLAASLHLDETSPHVHLMVTPIDDEGRVRQASFISGRQGMRDNDQAMRQRLAGAGYDVDRQPRGGNRSNMSIDGYAQWQNRIAEVEAREVQVEDRELHQGRNRGIQKRNQEILKQRKEAHDAREASLRAREQKVAKGSAEAAEDRQRAAQERTAASEQLKRAKSVFVEADDSAKQYKAAGQELRQLINDGKGKLAELEPKAAKVAKRVPFAMKPPSIDAKERHRQLSAELSARVAEMNQSAKDGHDGLG